MRSRLPLILLLAGVALLASAQHTEEEEDVMVADFEDEPAAAAQDQRSAPARATNKHAPYTPPTPSGPAAMLETFATDPFSSGRWVKSGVAKYRDQPLGYGSGLLPSGIPGDKALLLEAPAKHYGLSRAFDTPLQVRDDTLVLQYEVRMHTGQECGGAYLKLLAAEPRPNLQRLDSDTPYVIMFGPDKCGATNKLHFILRHKNPVSGVWEEKHLKGAPSVPVDTKTHLYTLVVRPDNTFQALIDGSSVAAGNLLESMDPPINPPAMIDDPADVKPADWVDEPRIPDPTARKPDDWDEEAPAEVPDAEAAQPEGWLDDEPEYVPDPAAEQPEDWDEEEDGEWEAPMVRNPRCESAPGCGKWKQPMKRNPEYKGKWAPPMIDNPAYKGEWKPRQIPNPAHFEDLHPHNLPPIVRRAAWPQPLRPSCTRAHRWRASAGGGGDRGVDHVWRHRL